MRQVRQGDRVQCLKAPSWAPLEYDDMVGQIGIVLWTSPGDFESEPAIGIQYPRTPFSDNKIAYDLSDRGVYWELV